MGNCKVISNCADAAFLTRPGTCTLRIEVPQSRISQARYLQLPFIPTRYLHDRPRRWWHSSEHLLEPLVLTTHGQPACTWGTIKSLPRIFTSAIPTGPLDKGRVFTANQGKAYPFIKEYVAVGSLHFNKKEKECARLLKATLKSPSVGGRYC